MNLLGSQCLSIDSARQIAYPETWDNLVHGVVDFVVAHDAREGGENDRVRSVRSELERFQDLALASFVSGWITSLSCGGTGVTLPGLQVGGIDLDINLLRQLQRIGQYLHWHVLSLIQ